MQGDFSRFSLLPADPWTRAALAQAGGGGARLDVERGAWTRVLFQQGRVQLDADLNEQAATGLALHRLLARDLIGEHGGPVGDLGFGIAPGDGDLQIGAGRYWVGGWPVRNTEPLPFATQPGVAEAEKGAAGRLAAGAGAFLAYLEVWERMLGAPAEAPNLSEPALGGVETTARAVLAWRVRLLEADVADEAAALAALAGLRPTGRMRAEAWRQDATAAARLCALDPEAAYRGPENQLYRVEIHRGGPLGAARFKWSRENASVALLPTSPLADWMELASLGRDDRLGLKPKQWVELVDLPAAMGVRPGPLARIAEIDPNRARVRLVGRENADPAPGKLLYLRRWDQTTADGDGGDLPVSAGWTELEDGVRVSFEDPGAPATGFRAGDHWMVPARVATGDVLWPSLPGGGGGAAVRVFMEPHGPERVVAPLAHRRPGAARPVKGLRRGFGALAQPEP